MQYFDNAFNILDVTSLLLVAITAARMMGQADSGSTSQVAAVGTLLLWLRVIQYLNGFDATAAYVRMTLSVIADMKTFLLIMVILVVGNACVLVLLYPLSLDAAANPTNSTATINSWVVDAAEHWAHVTCQRQRVVGIFSTGCRARN